MPSSSTIRLQIEAVLASRFPSALTQAPMMIRPIVPTGVMEVDALLEGGFPAGAITELAGPECSAILPGTNHTDRQRWRVDRCVERVAS